MPPNLYGEEPMSFLAQGERDTRKQRFSNLLSHTPDRKIAENRSEVPYDPFALCLGMARQSWLKRRIQKIAAGRTHKSGILP